MFTIFELWPLWIIVGITTIVLIGAISPNFISNDPRRSARAKEMKEFAKSLGLSYLAEEERSLKQKLFGYTKKTNIITGKFNGKDILIYDFKTVTNYPLGVYGNDPKKFTYVNGQYLKSRLPVEDIKEHISNSSDLISKKADTKTPFVVD